jgi:hypothetical protein
MLAEVYAGLMAAQPWVPMAGKQLYQRVRVSLLHLAQCTRPDIALPVSAFAAYAAAPTEIYSTLVDIVRYVGRVLHTLAEYCSTGHHFWWEAEAMPILQLVRTHEGVPQAGLSPCMGVHCGFNMEAEYQACGAAAREGLSLLKASGSLLHCPETFHW